MEKQLRIWGYVVSLRAASDDDVGLLCGWFSDPLFVVWWGGETKTREEVIEKYIGRDPGRLCFVVENDGDPIGFIQAWSGKPLDGGIDIVLKPEAQGQGLGVDAVRTLASHLRAVGWKGITVDPLVENQRAIRAFEKAGFVRDGREGERVILAFQPTRS